MIEDYGNLSDRGNRPRHGHWVFNPKDAIEMMFTLPKCSECGAESSDGGNYCSHCGATISEVDEDAKI